ncbi:ribosomal RNA-processing protein 8 [Oryzias melastigma]|uniref:Ribosomal RNA-processing protein 8 n=1 Tax=Oryzias melastigma TaxID=30732 RepID=A0A3B3D051_ORYME|nr:ribosomal RNA-processing protein 8 [Oryzias melastigma]
MFNEDAEWNDEEDALVLSKSVFGDGQKRTSSSNLTPKTVGKKSLLRTLQTLGSVPEWKSSNDVQGSDSEAEEAPSPKKRKKKRKKRKPVEKSEEQQNNRDADQPDEDKPALTKKKKKGSKTENLKKKSTSAGETKDEEITETTKNEPQSSERLSRQQWKNKMKNKRKCTNKYRSKTLEEDVNKGKNANKEDTKKELDSHSSSNNNDNLTQTTGQKKKKDRENKQLKRRNTDRDTNVFSTGGLKKQKAGDKAQSKNSTLEASDDRIHQDIQELHTKTANDELSPSKRKKVELSKEQSLKKQKLRDMLSRHVPEKESPAEQKGSAASGPEEEEKPEEAKLSRSDILRSRMEQRLESARFRYINELLYSSSSGDAKRMFQQDPEAFWVYHKGYTSQVQRWPVNPVDQIISYIQKKPPSLVVADFGCGDCKIARSVKNKVHSFDLAATCELVTVCDMSKVPLRDASVDIAVFCLSLMGTNLADFLAEANRVLKNGGVLKVAEVASRFENVRNFITALSSLGFKMVSKDVENTHFHSFEFIKTGNAPKNVKKFGIQLKPCVYKKR